MFLQVLNLSNHVNVILNGTFNLNFQVELLPTKLQLDETLGAQSLIKDIRIFSGGAGKILLEELQGYNILTNVKYTYEATDVLRKKRALTEGSTYHSVATRGTCGGTESHKNNVIENPYFKVKSGTTTSTFSDDDFLKVKCLLPIQTGIFQNSKVFPIMMTEGLQIEILLEDNEKVMRQLDQVMRLKRHRFMPIYHSKNGSLNGPDATGTGNFKSIFLANDNMIKSVDSVPFCVGEEIQFVEVATGTPIVPAPVCKISSISACATNSFDWTRI